MKIYVVLKITDYNTGQFEFSGVYDSQHLAIINCINDDYCYILSEMNFRQPDGNVIVPACYPTRGITMFPNGENLQNML